MTNFRFIHRVLALVVMIITLVMGATGTMIQLLDFYSIYGHRPATEQNVRAMHESFDGPPDFAVRMATDYAAQPLPADAPYRAMLDRAMRSAQAQLSGAPIRFVEFRMTGNEPVVQVALKQGLLRFDAGSGTFIDRQAKIPSEPLDPPSQRNVLKYLHRLSTLGHWAVYLTVFMALALGTLIVTGMVIYLKLLFQRRKIGKTGLFWSGGGQWRSLHRIISVTCSLFLVVVTLSGGWLAIEGLYRGYDVARTRNLPKADPNAFDPLARAQMDDMLSVTLAATQGKAQGEPLKVIRLRNYGGYRQGVVVTGGDASQQLVFNADTGAAMTETEPGYPRQHFPLGWQMHQWTKSIHRGDMIGLPGRWMDLAAGLAMVYLSISGAFMYWQMWRKRSQSGRTQLVWK